MGKWNDQSVTVNERFVSGVGDGVPLRFRELYVGPVHSMPEPHLAHGRKLKFAHDNSAALTEIERTGDSVYTR